ncbi:MAG: hypothetical protein ACI3ZL_09475 [Candidatus Cryptobacteroides sp.]
MKKMSKLILASILTAGVFSLSGCIENLEPAGISDLRGAKADLLRAQTALQAAQAAKVEAEAALILAQAKVEEAKVKQVEAEVAYQEALALQAQYQAEYQKLVNEAYAKEQEDEHNMRVAELERYLAESAQLLAQAENAAKKAAAELELELQQIQVKLLEAQAKYEVALKDLALAKVSLTPNQQAYLAEYYLNVMLAEADVDDLNSRLEQAADNLAAAIATLDAQKADKQAIRNAEKAVALAQKRLAGAQEAAEEAKAALELDPKVTDWAAKRDELKALKETLEKAKAEASYEESAAVEELDDATAELNAAIEEYELATGYTFNRNTGLFSLLPQDSYYGTKYYSDRIYVEAPVDADGNKLFAGDFCYENGIYFQYGHEDDAYAIFDARIEGLGSLSETYFDTQIEMVNSTIAAIEESAEAELAEYDAAVAAYKSGDVTAYYKAMDENWDVDTPVAEYNAALADFLSALETYNEVYKKKYPEGHDDEEAAIWEEYNATVNAAYAAKVKAYQDARDVRSAAEIEYKKADLAHQRAQRTYNAVVDAVYTSTGYSTVADLEAAIAAYEALADPTASDTEAYQKNKAALEQLSPAQKAMDAAKDAWTAADDAWTKAQNTYSEAKNIADETYNAAVSAAVQKREDALEDLNVSATYPVDDAYWYSVNDKFYEAQYTLFNSISALNTYVCLATTDAEIIYPYGNGTWSGSAPDYLVDEETQTLKTIKSADLFDAEYFLETKVADLAGALVSINVYARAYAYDNEGNYLGSLSDWYYYNYGETMPLVLPSGEEYAAWIETCKEQALTDICNQVYSLGYEPRNSYTILYTSASYAQKYDCLNEIAKLEAKKADLALLPDFIRALEAAKAEFVAFVEAKTAEIDALRTYVEENWAEISEAWDEMVAEQDAYYAELNEIDKMVTYLTEMIELYIGSSDVEAFVASLETVYEQALDNVQDAEYDLEDAQDALAAVLAGDTTPVEAAQKQYDKIAAELADALKALEEAAAELEAAIARIGESTAETPAA